MWMLNGHSLETRVFIYLLKYKHYPGFLWRFARSAHLVWLATNSDSDSVMTLNGDVVGGAESHWLDVGLSIARAAVRQVEAPARTLTGEQKIDAARAYQWLAMFVGLEASASSTAVSRRIELGYEFQVR